VTLAIDCPDLRHGRPRGFDQGGAMPKMPIPTTPSVPNDPRPRRLPRGLWNCILAAVLAPILWEGTAVCYSQWCEVMGYPREVHTPILETAHQILESTQASLRESIELQFQEAYVDPKIVLLFAGVLVVLAMMMLKR
jgi:hypothetical protein